MSGAQIFSRLLVVTLSVAASCGCTRVDNQSMGRRLPKEPKSSGTSTHAIETELPGQADLEAPMSATESYNQQALPPRTSAPDSAEAEALFDELDSVLQELDSLLGSTENWEISLP